MDTRRDDVLGKIERTRQARRHKFYLRDEYITLSHGSGGKATHNLIEGVFAPAFSNPLLDRMDDSATFALEGTEQSLAFTTDTYVVSPLFFAGGDIGKLAVHGTINDLAMVGASPLYLSVGIILEEGFPIANLRRIVASMAQAAADAGVAIVTGDTKVVQRGKADGLHQYSRCGSCTLYNAYRTGTSTDRRQGTVERTNWRSWYRYHVGA